MHAPRPGDPPALDAPGPEAWPAPTLTPGEEAVTRTTSEEIQEGVQAGRDLPGQAFQAARHAIEEARRRGLNPEEAAAGAARGAIQAATSLGEGLMERAIRAGIRGALRAAGAAGEDLGLVAHHTVRAGLSAGTTAGLEVAALAQALARDVLECVVAMGGDPSVVARDVVAGAIEAARDLGLPPEEAATAAATGAVEIGNQLEGHIGRSLLEALRRPIQGVVVTLAGPPGRGSEQS